MLNITIDLHPDVGDQSGSLATTPLFTGYAPNLSPPQSDPNLISMADAENEDRMTVELPHLRLPEEYVPQTARRDPGAVQRAAQKYMVHGEVPVLQQRLPLYTQHLMRDIGVVGRNQSYNALQYQQKQFENAAQEHQRRAHKHVEIAAALATNRTAAHMTSGFRDIENDVEAHFSHQQQ